MIGSWLIVLGVIFVGGFVSGIVQEMKGRKVNETKDVKDEEAEFALLSRIFESKLFKLLLFFFIKLPIGIIILAMPFYFTGPVGGMIIWTCLVIMMKIL